MTSESTAGRAALPWIALALGFSPVLVELARHLGREPWTCYVALFPFLLARAAATAARPVSASRSGYLWIAAGAAFEIVGVGGGIERLARPGLALAVIGLCRLRGIAELGTALLALWMIPLPSTLASLASPALESALLLPAAGLGRALGLAAASAPPGLTGPGGRLALEPPDGGLPLAALLSGIGWYASLRADGGRSAPLRAGAFGLAAFPLQALGIALAALILASGQAGLAALALRPGVWLAAAGLAVAWAERSARAR